MFHLISSKGRIKAMTTKQTNWITLKTPTTILDETETRVIRKIIKIALLLKEEQYKVLIIYSF